MTKEQLKLFQEMMKTASGALTLKDFETKFSMVLDVIKQIKDFNEKDRNRQNGQIEDIKSTVDRFYKDANGNLEETKRKALAYCVANCSQESVALVKTETSKMTSKIEKRLAEIKNGIDGKQGVQGIQGKPGRDGSPDSAQMIANKLNKEEEIIDKKVIKGLEEDLARILRLVQMKTGIGGGGVGKSNVDYYDLSSSLNGSTKTFSMPSFLRIIDVKLSSAPVLRPNVDWTSDSSAATLTFTSTIDETTLLAAGQSLIILYAF